MTQLKFKLDSTGFPMIWVDTIGAYIHWLPVTKIQFEYFLCVEPSSDFDANWYDEILYLNPRVTPREIRANNYWHAFLTGIRPEEIRGFVRWCGEGYSIPTLDDWFMTYKTLKALPAEPLTTISNMGNLRERVRTLLTQLNSVSGAMHRDIDYNEQTLADQMFMRMGVIEWVECPQLRTQWGGMGQTHQEFHGSFFTPDHGQPSKPLDPNGPRLHYYGFRLIWRDR